ncbi:glycosyltransferase family 2 protein [Branchiibius cervicis]|uniref:Glycosyltransferase family 2 protein n=1 Tax=Branchiibius cervicis TaxID=908252 RepID=A0ABW2AUP5_9MICO
MTASRRDHLVVILSYGDPGRAVRCATSCLADGTADLLVVVNPVSPGLPADRALTELVAREQQVDLLALPENRGFTGGMNAGLHWGRRRGYGILTVLNDDTTAGPGVLSRLGDDVRAIPAAAIAPRIDYADRPGQPWSLGVTIDPDDLLPRHLSESEFAALPRRDDGLVAVPMFTGCCICAGTDVWDRVGDFDDDYFLYFEDSDWSQRARQLGVPLLIDDAAVLTHEVSASSQGAPSPATTTPATCCATRRSGTRAGPSRCGCTRDGRCGRRCARPATRDRPSQPAAPSYPLLAQRRSRSVTADRQGRC